MNASMDMSLNSDQKPGAPPTRRAERTAWHSVLAPWLAFLCASSTCLAGTPLLTLNYTVTGTALQVTPANLSVPTGIPGSVLVSVLSGGSTNSAAANQLSAGAYVQAVLRGPAFPQPRTIVGAPNAPLLLPAINLVG